MEFDGLDVSGKHAAGGRREGDQRLVTGIRDPDDLKLAEPSDLDAAISQVLEPVERAWDTIDELTPIGE